MSSKKPVPDGTLRPAAGDVSDPRETLDPGREALDALRDTPVALRDTPVALRDALDVWREDAVQTAARLDVTGGLADRIVAAAEQGSPLAAVPRGARWYAAAAVLLIAIGVAGTFMARQAGPRHGGVVRFVDIQEALVQVLADDPEYSPSLEGR